jgi:hypothetical protein
MPESLNHPTTVWRKYKGGDEHKAEQMARGEYEPPPAKTPPREKPTMAEELAALQERVRDLEGQLQERTEERDQARDELERLRAEYGIAPPAPQPADDIDLATMTDEQMRARYGALMGSEAAEDDAETESGHEENLSWYGSDADGFIAVTDQYVYVIKRVSDGYWPRRTVRGFKVSAEAIELAIENPTPQSIAAVETKTRKSLGDVTPTSDEAKAVCVADYRKQG